MYPVPTCNVSSGLPATTLDVRDTTVLNNAARNPLGTKYIDPSAPFTAWRYVRYNSTANAAIQAGPAVVWWTDNTYTTVTSTVSEAISKSHVAGIMNLSTATGSGPLAGLGASAAKAALNGNFIFIQVAGHLAGCLVAASTAVGDYGLATQADWTTTGGFSRIAKGAAMTDRVAFFAETAVSNNLSDVFIVIEQVL